MIKLGGEKLAPQITCYPSYGFRTGSGDWLINLLGITFQTPPLNLRQKMLLKLLGNAMKANDAELQGETFRNRTRPFFFEADKGQTMLAEFGDRILKLKKKSRRNGRFDNWLRIDNELVQQNITVDSEHRQLLNFTISTAHSDSQPIHCTVQLLSETGLSIISDIDDTIKESLVADRRELLMNTFVREFRSVEGMADIYRRWQDVGAIFHYVSSSPWQLFDSLQRMQNECGFPAGTMHLRNFRLRDQFLKRVMIRRKGKATAIKRLVKNLPQHKFILIGDSGEKDPEIYQKFARRFPNQVQGIFIRDLNSRPLASERIQKLSRAIGDERFGTYRTASELVDLAEPLVRMHANAVAARV